MTDVFATAIICVTVLTVCAMAYNVLNKLLTNKFVSDITRLEEDINGHAEDLQKARGALQVEIVALRERLGRLEMSTSGRRHS